MPSVEVLAVLAACLLGLVVAFQLALASGARWGAMAYGGRAVRADGRLPIGYRYASAVAALVLAGAIVLVLAAGGVADVPALSDGVLTASMWVLAVLLAVNTLGNLAGRHPVERFGAGGLTAVVCVLCVAVALLR